MAGFAPHSLVLWAQAPRLYGNPSWLGLPPVDQPGHLQWLARGVSHELSPSAELLIETDWPEQAGRDLRELRLAVQPPGEKRIAFHRLHRESATRYRVEGAPKLEGAKLYSFSFGPE